MTSKSTSSLIRGADSGDAQACNNSSTGTSAGQVMAVHDLIMVKMQDARSVYKA